MDKNNTNNTAIVELTDESFVEQVLHADTPVLVDFKAEWCGPCKFMAPIFSQLAPEYEGKVKFAKMDVDENPGVSGALEISSIPTLLLFYRNNVLNVGVGAMREPDLRRWIDTGLGRMDDLPADVGVVEAAEAAPTQPTA